MTTLTMFTWGYGGWGSSTRQLKSAIDWIKQTRGFAPPMFVDLRLARSGRAEGFQGDEFEKTIGRDRHRWMPALGNLGIRKKSGPRILIKEPPAVEELLGMALRSNARGQQLLIFCQCPWPRAAHDRYRCHRVEIASLLLKTATKRNVSLSVLEWPGGKPHISALKVRDEQIDKVRRGGVKNIVLGTKQPSIDLLALPWSSLVTLKSASSSLRVLANPAVFRGGKWLLPVVYGDDDGPRDVRTMLALSRRDRALLGLGVRSS